jgi:IclR family transcriptional regulator, acetate operon repressor
MSESALIEEEPGEDLGAARPVVHGAFEVLAALRQLGSSRVSELQRGSGLPRTTVRRLLIQLEDVGAVESSTGRWRLGPTVLELGAGVPASRDLRAVARRPLMDLATATGELVALVVESAGELLVIDVLPGTRPLAFEPEPGMVLDDPSLAPARAYHRARRGDLRTVLDTGAFDRRISSVAAPLRLSPQDLAVVWLILPAGTGIHASLAEATRRTAGRIASHLPHVP